MDGIGEPQGSSQHLVRTPDVKRVRHGSRHRNASCTNT